HPQLRFSNEFLHSLLVAALLRYLAVAHFGRGRGNFAEGEAPSFWQAEVEAVLSENKPDFVALWHSARSAPEQLERSQLQQRLSVQLLSSMSQILRKLYP
ncbi:MAG: DUF3482 domain-containing protein, partial [Burkholderiales bacterium]|nr:DUF3482 domain-containing protein [Burkholderiales bacterium]